MNNHVNNMSYGHLVIMVSFQHFVPLEVIMFMWIEIYCMFLAERGFILFFCPVLFKF